MPLAFFLSFGLSDASVLACRGRGSPLQASKLWMSQSLSDRHWQQSFFVFFLNHDASDVEHAKNKNKGERHVKF